EELVSLITGIAGTPPRHEAGKMSRAKIKAGHVAHHPIASIFPSLLPARLFSHAPQHFIGNIAALDFSEFRYSLACSCVADTSADRACADPRRVAAFCVRMGGWNLFLVFPVHLDSVCAGSPRRHGPVGGLGLLFPVRHSEGPASGCV